MSYDYKQPWRKPKLIFSHILHRHVPQEEHDAAVASANPPEENGDGYVEGDTADYGDAGKDD